MLYDSFPAKRARLTPVDIQNTWQTQAIPSKTRPHGTFSLNVGRQHTTLYGQLFRQAYNGVSPE